jgi:hypothetical protein
MSFITKEFPGRCFETVGELTAFKKRRNKIKKSLGKAIKRLEGAKACSVSLELGNGPTSKKEGAA